ncbi:SAM37 [Candida margitis]|uniref:SAM37 n=1 Tax=Candida margitis TaxID=1775924 RepID=UPI00222768BA|nr:SAM37 [Candida margitis]KAI5953982.1 SAM37 [Candida margitis]
MIELHVWGDNEEVSIISPSCIASVWLISLISHSQDVPFKIVPSNNPHLSKLNELPLLIDKESQYSGFRNIATYLTTKYDNTGLLSLSESQKLVDDSLIAFFETKFGALNKYNLFSNTKNYENYTRKLFAKFFPFPMMYNQASKFYNDAQSQVRLVGLGENKSSFLNFVGSGEETKTEYFNSDLDEESETSRAISGLHEKSLVQKSETKKVLRESQSSMKCLVLVEQLINRLEKLKKEHYEGGGFVFGDQPSAGDVLCLAYIFALTHSHLPDKFISNYLSSKESGYYQVLQKSLLDLKSKASVAGSFRKPTGKEIPGLYNEVGYWTGLVEY